MRLLLAGAVLAFGGCRAMLPYAVETGPSGSDGNGAAVGHLVFGRLVRAQYYDERGTEVWRRIGSYDEPLPCMAVTECAAIVLAELYDDDADGRWDRWTRRVRQGERCFVEHRVDTDGDGAPDWEFVARWQDYEETTEAIRARRGY
jgi:hypothetical protein